LTAIAASIEVVSRMLVLPKILRHLAFGVCWSALILRGLAETAENDFFAAPIADGSAQWVVFANERVGWQAFADAGFLGSSTVVANVEAGHIWFGHEVFNRPASVTNPLITYSNSAALNELDYHATMVGHVLAGSGYNGTNYSNMGLGMVPEATVLSGSVAVAYSTNNLGSFATTYDSVVTPYRAFFTGEGGVRADVINSSWGGYDPAAVSPEVVALDGLAAQNPEVALIVSAGNSASQPVGAPADGFNNMAVGSLGSKTFLVPSGFSSRGLNDFYNPVTDQLVEDARVAVRIAAPGEVFFLAAYLGDSGGLGAAFPEVTVEPPPTDQYFYNLDGTSYASPMVAGGVALLKDAARRDSVWNLNGVTNAFDTRVAASVLMAGSLETYGWSNGQSNSAGGAEVTTQALDVSTGAGAMDLLRSAEAYLFGTRGTGGGTIASSGWDFGTLGVGGRRDYTFAGAMAEDVELTVALNWFAGREYDMETGLGRNLSFADLNLEVWEVDEFGFTTLDGQSATIYNNAEFLRMDLTAGRTYGLRVTFDNMVFDETGGVLSESYGLSWLASGYDTVYWNPAGTNRVWDGLVQNWSTAPPGAAGDASSVTTALDQVVWGSGTNDPVAVTVEGAQMARSMTFNSATTMTGTDAASIYLRGGGLTAAEGLTGGVLIDSGVSLLLSGDQAWRNFSAFDLVVDGHVTGTGDVVMENQSTGTLTVGGLLNLTGHLINQGSGDGEVRLSGLIGSEVVSIKQSSPTSPMVISGDVPHGFSGSLQVAAGELVVNGNLTGSSLTSVSAGAVLSGSGTLSTATVAGEHRPGNSPGIQTFTGNLSYESAASVVWELTTNTTAGRGEFYDGVDVGGQLAFADGSQLQLVFSLPESQVDWSDPFWESSRAGSAGWLVFNVEGGTVGFSNLNLLMEDWVDSEGQLFSLVRSQSSFSLASVGSDVYLNYAAVPEPRVWWLLSAVVILFSLRASGVGRGCRGSGRRGS
jgi:hypothetical protein